MMGHKKGLHMVAWVLVMIGGLNWLLFGLFHWEIGSVLGDMTGMVARIVYILVGLSAVYEIATHGTRCRECRSTGDLPQGDKPMSSSQPQ